jgi:ribosomal protein S7
MSIKLANEIIDTSNDIGNTIKKKRRNPQDGRCKQSICAF